MHLLDLSIEILTQIFDNLYFVDLYTCLHLNHTVQALITNSVRLQYKISCGEAGVLDNPHCRLSIADRLSLLRNHEHSWRHFQHGYRTSFEVPFPSSGKYSTVTSSSYILGRTVVDDQFTALALKAVVLPTGHENDFQPDWREINPGKKLLGFGSCVEEHDLIALVTSMPDPQDLEKVLVEVTLRRFSTGKLHEDAEQEVWQVCTTKFLRLPPVSVEIAGENLAIILVHMDFETCDTLLHIFNWKKGVKKCEPIFAHDCGFIFLREDLLMNADTRGTLEIYHIPHSSSPGPVQLIQSFGLPVLSSGWQIIDIACCSHPNPTALNGTTYISSSRAFSNQPDDAIITLTLDILLLTSGYGFTSFTMIVHRRAILNHITLPIVGQSTVTMSWETWGPPVTRWFNTASEAPSRIAPTSGQRCVQIGADAREVASRIRLLDFNPYNVRCMQDKQGRGQEAYIRVIGLGSDEDENVCPVHGVFKEDIQSALPYMLCTSRDVFDYDAVLIDEERLLGLRSPPLSPVVQAVDVIYFG